MVDLKPPVKGQGFEGVLKGIDEFMAHSVRSHHPGFNNPIWGGWNPAAFAGELIAATTNTSMYTYELAPMASLIELELITKQCELAGLPEGSSGVLTTGGSNGNMMAMLCARQKMFPDCLHKGSDGTKLVAYVSEESHYSVIMSANVIGIGYDNCVKVKADKNGRMCMIALDEEIAKTKAAGKTPFIVIATCGTTVRGQYDPIRAISAICKKDNIWMHCDGAWGGSILLSRKHRVQMDGCELADSICWDAHKLMGVPLICASFLI